MVPIIGGQMAAGPGFGPAAVQPQMEDNISAMRPPPECATRIPPRPIGGQRPGNAMWCTLEPGKQDLGAFQNQSRRLPGALKFAFGNTWSSKLGHLDRYFDTLKDHLGACGPHLGSFGVHLSDPSSNFWRGRLPY